MPTWRGERSFAARIDDEVNALACERDRNRPPQSVLLVNDRVVDLLEGEFDVGVRIGRLRDSSLIAGVRAITMKRSQNVPEECPAKLVAALARLRQTLSSADQRIIVQATRTPHKVRWPKWWSEHP